jgi:hypothetical protein
MTVQKLVTLHTREVLTSVTREKDAGWKRREATYVAQIFPCFLGN